MRFPLQPIVNNRFVGNKVVEYLLEKGGLDLNDLAIANLPREDHEQFAQLISYSVSGWGSLSYVSDEAEAAAWQQIQSPDPRDDQIIALEEKIQRIREQCKAAAAELFQIFPEDLKE